MPITVFDHHDDQWIDPPEGYDAEYARFVPISDAPELMGDPISGYMPQGALPKEFHYNNAVFQYYLQFATAYTQGDIIDIQCHGEIPHDVCDLIKTVNETYGAGLEGNYVISFGVDGCYKDDQGNIVPWSDVVVHYRVMKLSPSKGIGRVGPAGPAGPIGPQGPKGDTGPQGQQGPSGVQGQAGADGATGPMGPQGNTGPKGDKGDQGPKGDTGLQGDKGDKGDAGDLTPKDYGIYALVADQINVNNGNVIQFASVKSQRGLSLSMFRAVLNPNKTYLIQAMLGGQSVTGSTYIQYSIYVDNAPTGNMAICASNSFEVSNQFFGNMAVAIVTTGATTSVVDVRPVTGCINSPTVSVNNGTILFVTEL